MTRKNTLRTSKILKLNIFQVYKEVVSGEFIASRPVMQELLSSVEKGLFEGVLVVEIERLARGDTMDQGIVAQTFKYSNTKIITQRKLMIHRMNSMKNTLNLDCLCLEENIRQLIDVYNLVDSHPLKRKNK